MAIITKIPSDVLIDSNVRLEDDNHLSEHRFQLIFEIICTYINIRLKHNSNLEVEGDKFMCRKRQHTNRQNNLQDY